MPIKVFKFGGASVKDAAAIENLRNILSLYPDEHLVVVVSAMGKTTNFLEKVVDTYRNAGDVKPLLDTLQHNHVVVAEQLVPDPGAAEILDIVFDNELTLFADSINVAQLLEQHRKFIISNKSYRIQHGDMSHATHYIIFCKIEIHFTIATYSEAFNLFVNLKTL